MSQVYKTIVTHIVRAAEGGIKEHVRYLLRYADRREFDRVLVTHPDRELSFWARSNQVRCLEVPIPDGLDPVVDIKAVLAVRRHFIEHRTSEHRTGSCERTSSHEMILHAHGAKAALITRLAGVLTSSPLGTPHSRAKPVLVYTVHGQPLRNHFSPSIRTGITIAERVLWRYCDAFIAVSSYIKAKFAEVSGVPDEKVLVIPNGVDVRRFCIKAEEGTAFRRELGLDPYDDWVIGSVSRFVPEKRPDIVLEAFARLKRTFEAAKGASVNARGIVADASARILQANFRATRRPRLLLVGDGPLRQHLETLAEDLGIRRDVVFAGTRPDVPRALAAMDVFVLASTEDGAPLALIEAMAAGKPVVVPATGSFMEVVKPSHGLLVRAGDPEALAAAIIRLLGDDGMRVRLGRAARVYAAEHLDALQMARKTEELYRELTACRHLSNGSRRGR